MQVIEGKLTQLGNSILNSTETTYSIVEIDNQVLTKVICKNSLANFLESALHQEGITKLYIHSIWKTKYIVGVDLPDGKKYAVKPPILLNLIMLIIFGLIFIGIYVGLIFFILAFFECKNYLSTLSAIKANHAKLLD